ncbi:esterase-like activity of phytase family protein [Sphingomonas xanthus]|nr:esterase-like activity of phytase family protein [Sphingomonas xanthus]
MAERDVQPMFMKSIDFSGLFVGAAILAAFVPIRALPDRRPQPPAEIHLGYRSVALPATAGPLRVAGAWAMTGTDRRLGGLSALTIDRGRFLAVSDLGAVVLFDPPAAPHPKARIVDLVQGPGPIGRKWARGAESIARDPQGRGWWIGYEQRHSLWLYDAQFRTAKAAVDLRAMNWSDNRGAEALVPADGELLVVSENGRSAIRIGPGAPRILNLNAGVDIADAATAPDGSKWVLLRWRGWKGIGQAVARLQPSRDGYRVGKRIAVPKAPLDNFEGMTFTAGADGRWRIWLLTDDGHRLMARNLLVALDFDLPVGNGKSPAGRAGLSRKTAVDTP